MLSSACVVEPVGVVTQAMSGRWPGHGSGLRQFAGGGGPGQAGANVLDMRDGLLEQFPDMIVVEVIDDAAPIPMADDQPEVAQETKLMRDG